MHKHTTLTLSTPASNMTDEEDAFLEVVATATNQQHPNINVDAEEPERENFDARSFIGGVFLGLALVAAAVVAVWYNRSLNGKQQISAQQG